MQRKNFRQLLFLKKGKIKGVLGIVVEELTNNNLFTEKSKKTSQKSNKISH